MCVCLSVWVCMHACVCVYVCMCVSQQYAMSLTNCVHLKYVLCGVQFDNLEDSQVMFYLMLIISLTGE